MPKRWVQLCLINNNEMRDKETQNITRFAEGIQALDRAIADLKEQSVTTLKGIITNEELICQLHICEKTAYNWRKYKGLKSYKVGRKIYYKCSEVSLWVEHNATLPNNSNILSK